MAPTRPDLNRVGKPTGLPWYAKDVEFCRPLNNNEIPIPFRMPSPMRKAAPPLSSQAQVGYNYRLMYKHVVSLARTTRAFHGAQIRKESSSCTCAAGMLEIGPHNLVHDWIGSPVNKSCPCRSRTDTGTGSGNGDSCEQTCHGENMGILYSAARDPIFYAHHANIDRLWTVWKTLHGREDYRDPSLLDTRFFFYDENKLLVSVRAGDAFDPDNLRYNYQRCPTPWIHKPKYIDKPTDILLHGNPSIPLRKPPLDFTEPVKILVDRRFPEEQLLIEGIRVQRNIAVKFDIFINLDDALLAVSYVDNLPREFAGTFHEAPQGTTADVERGCGQSSLCVGISEVLSDLNVGEEETSIVVTLVPKVELEEPIKICDIRMV